MATHAPLATALEVQAGTLEHLYHVHVRLTQVVEFGTPLQPVLSGEMPPPVEPLRRFGAPVADLIQPMPYIAQQSLFDAGVPAGQHSYWKAGQLSTLTDEAIDTLVDECEQVTSPRTVTLIEHHHGAMPRVAPDATAFPHRETPYELVVLSLWTDAAESERHIQWTRGVFQAMQPFFRSGVYVNALGDDESDRVRAAYGVNYDRLVALKNKYDPTNFFCLNQNIAPAGTESA